MSELRIIPYEEVFHRWEEIERILRPATDTSSGEYIPIDLLEDCVFMEVVEDGETHLVFANRVIRGPRFTRVHVVALAGRNLHYLKRHLHQFELWCASVGAKAFSTSAKDPRIIRAHTRFFGMHPEFTVSWKEINLEKLLETA